MRALPIVFAAMIALVASAQAAATDACPLAPDDLKAALGRPFKAGVPERGIVGKACTYTAGDVKLWIDAGPNPMPSAEMYRKISHPPGTRWKPVTGDPDKAVHVVFSPSDDSPFASLSYERKGWLVNITVTGVHAKSDVDLWNAKLVQLKRIP